MAWKKRNAADGKTVRYSTLKVRLYPTQAQAFRMFFKSPETFGHPNFKRKKAGQDSFIACNHMFESGPTIYTTRDGIRMTKAGIVKARFSRRP